MSYGDLTTIDARIMLDAARHLALGEGLIVDPAIGIPGLGGRHYAYYGPANSLLMLPLVLAARLATVMVSLPVPLTFVQEFLAAMAGAWLKALGVVLVYAVLQLFDDDPRRNVLAAGGGLLIGFDFQYGRSYFAEVPAAACLLAAAYTIIANRSAVGYAHLFRTGSALATATAFRWEIAVFVPVFAIVAWRQRRFTAAAALTFAVPLCAMALVLGAYNTIRFGAFWRTGYERLPLPASPIEGWVGLLVAPGAGLLWFAPWVLSIPALARGRHRHDPRIRDLGVLVLGLSIVACLLYGSWSYWAGGLSWGPRFLVPLVPLMFVFAVLAWRRSVGARRIGLPFAAACVVLNVLLVIAPHERLHAYAAVQGWTEAERVWAPSRTPWLHQPRMAFDVLGNLPRIHDFAERARVRMRARSQPQLPGEIDMTDALEHSVTLNVPAVWWVRLLVLGVPSWLAISLGLAGLTAAGLLFAAAAHAAGTSRGVAI
ncbi:MAG TPA: hypothetical protein VG106_00410 [Vicinamibacterales bacterium]|nr:hypothetical protein [Vicinamibacterales bacterium]